MSRIETRFADLKQRGRKALIPFITAGDPAKDITVTLMHILVQSGADLLELGVPFSDPMADGPVIQHASERALVNGVSLRDVLAMVAEFRKKDNDTPVILMGYLNPIEALGYAEFADLARQAGVDGALTVDLPPEEGQELVAALQQQGLDTIYLLAPTSTAERIQRIADMASGFLYYVSLKGVTGAGNLDLSEVRQRLDSIRRHTGLPLGVGFGINSPEIAAEVSTFADAVVVGSAIVKRIAEYESSPDVIMKELQTFVGALRQAMDTAAVNDKQTCGGQG
ncbi:MAG: tryptophan synthase subunit alpha [Gammaproteobacteria bacterium]|nr:MAG: tryptophan synthase subunit alpha [Gammaproteobacteria bacterium]